MQTPEDFLEANGFESVNLDRTALVSAFLKEMDAGLKGGNSSLAMIPTYVSPSGELKRDTPVSVLDAGGTNLRGATVCFPSGSTEAKIEHKEKGEMPGTSAYVSPDEFYRTFAAHLERTKPFAADPAVGFCFSYACEAASDGDAKLLHWTKQIQAPEIVGQWIGSELKKRLSFVPSKMLVLNDTVTTLLAGKACEKPGERFSAYIGFILGTGTNVAYVQKTSGIGKLPAGDYPSEMIINSESGGFSKIAQSKFDAAMDAKMRDTGKQVFEKMIAGAYLGAIGLEIFKAAAKSGFFSETAARQIAAMQQLESMHLDNFCAKFDNGAPNPLDKVFADANDAAIARRLATPVFERAAVLTAIHLAAFIVKTGGGTDSSAPVCVCVDGSTYYKTRTVDFPGIVKRELDRMLEPRNISFALTVCPDDAPMVGAAVAVLLK
jgi:hexokinase